MVTDRRRLPGRWEDALVEGVAAASAIGVDLVQIRERDLDGGPLLRLVRRCVEAVRHTRTRILVNDRLDVALVGGAHGVQLRGASMAAPRVRALAPTGFLIGRSVHAPAEASRVTAEGDVDFLLFGNVYETSSKPDQPAAGIAALRQVAAATPLPVLAIGGITTDRLVDVARARAAGIAAIGLFAGASREQLQLTLTRAALAFDGA